MSPELERRFAHLAVEAGWLAAQQCAELERRLAAQAEAPTDPLGRWAGALTEPIEDVPRRGRFVLDSEQPPRLGGMGRVWLAHDDRLGRTVALKEVRPDAQHNDQMRQRFLVEAQVTAQLQHPGIVPVYERDRAEDGAAPYYTMRFVEGRTLTEAVRDFHERRRQGRAGVLELRELLLALVAVCNTLAYAHARGVVHRDLKPGNVILGRYGEVVVLDWGLAKVLGKPDDPAVPAIVLDVEPEQTRPGAVGTLAYMPPEQARGEMQRIDRRSDVFGLGAMLYEVLTGRPPFTGSDADEVLVLAQQGKVVPPRSAAGWVPRPLEAVCLKALAARPGDRYQGAAELADEVKRWLAGEPVQAWPEPLVVKAGRWVRKNRVLAAATAAALLVALLLGTAGGVYRQQQRQRAREQAEAGLAQAAQLRQDYRFADAEAMLEQVRGWIDQVADSELQQRVARAEADLQLARDLDRVRQEAATLVEGKWDAGRVRVQYPEVLSKHELDVLGGDLDELADAIRASAVREDIIAALDDWAKAETDPQKKQRLLRLANRADEPDPWRQAVRQAVAQRDERRLQQLVLGTGEGKPTPGVALLLARTFRKDNVEATALLRRMQLDRPRDFWISLTLGERLYNQGKLQEAAECFLVAVALRPRTGVAHNNLGVVLKDKGKLDEAITCFKRAIEIDPKYATAHDNLGAALYDKGKVDEAITRFREAIALDPRHASAHSNLGAALLLGKAKVDEAIAYFKKAIALAPRFAKAHTNLGLALRAKRQVDEAIACFRRAIEIAPRFAWAHNNLGLDLRARGQVDEAIACFKRAIEIEPRNVMAHLQLAWTWQEQDKLAEAEQLQRKVIKDLAPSDAVAHTDLGWVLFRQGKPAEAEKLYRKAIELDSRFAPAHTNLGLALRAKGQVDEAIACFKNAIEIDPRNVGAHLQLAETLRQQGKLAEAEKLQRKAIDIDPTNAAAHIDLGNTLKDQGKVEEAIACHNKAIASNPKFGDAHGALGQALMQQGQFVEAQQSFRRCLALLPAKDPKRAFASQLLQQCQQRLDLDGKLKALLAGKEAPTDPASQVQLAALALQPFKRLYLTAVRLYRDAFTRQPHLADVHRYNAACAAARAGTGQGKDVAQLADADRAEMRYRALGWLHDDLAVHTRQLGRGPVVAGRSRQALLNWQKDPDLAAVRDPDALGKLPEAEQVAWRNLWAHVAALLARTKDKP
jgi:tetratricopeptide (TPR) repeat protein/tRNA A-37 threonylcarbamoyl transferase component Bud32